MMFWWLVVGVLVVATILLTMLLAPLPSALHAAVVGLIDKIQRPLWVVLSVMAWVLFDTTMEMRSYQEHPPQDQSLNLVAYHNKKWRAERNFYMVAFAFTLLLVLVRLQSVAHDEAALREENRHLRDLQRVNRPSTTAATAATAKTETKKAQ
jgi:hypothetical protein